MEYATKDYIINTVYKTNILPLISECNTSCIFCSHKQNPRDVEVFRMPKMTAGDFKEIIDFLSPDRKIVIGESATRIIEGEPLLHKDFLEILTLLRRKFKNTPIQITTNGILLNEYLVDKIVELGNIEMNISVNSIDPFSRKRILGLKNDDQILRKILMIKNKIKFSGSCVVVPEVLEWEEFEHIVEVLNDNNADVVRVFLPGYTSMAQNRYKLEDIFRETESHVKRLREKYEIPIIIEPSFVADTQCRIEGVVRNTPAYTNGIKTGDIILKIIGEPVSTRVEAFNRAFRLSDPVLTIERDSKELELVLDKKKNCSPGFVTLYDIDPYVGEQINVVTRQYKAQNVLFVTSELAFEIMNNFLESLDYDFNWDIISAKNAFFGGTIKCAGLLTVQDILDDVSAYLKNNNNPDLILLPPIMFDHRNRDLLGRNLQEVEEAFGIPVCTP